MAWKSIRQRSVSFTAGGLLGLLFVATPAARADLFSIFDVLTSVIGSNIGSSLSAMNTISSTVQKDMRTVLFPVSLISQTQNFVNGIIVSYRGWMSTVFTMRTESAQLSSTQLLEVESLSGLQGQIGSMQSKATNINTFYTQAMGALPTAAAAPQAHRQMMDMADAVTKNGLSQSVIGDQSAASFVSMANGLENQSASSAPGTAPMLSASAKAAELSSLAGQHKLLAAMLREEAGALANETASVKQSISQTQQLGDNMKATSIRK